MQVLYDHTVLQTAVNFFAAPVFVVVGIAANLNGGALVNPLVAVPGTYKFPLGLEFSVSMNQILHIPGRAILIADTQLLATAFDNRLYIATYAPQAAISGQLAFSLQALLTAGGANINLLQLLAGRIQGPQVTPDIVITAVAASERIHLSFNIRQLFMENYPLIATVPVMICGPTVPDELARCYRFVIFCVLLHTTSQFLVSTEKKVEGITHDHIAAKQESLLLSA